MVHIDLRFFMAFFIIYHKLCIIKISPKRKNENPLLPDDLTLTSIGRLAPQFSANSQKGAHALSLSLKQARYKQSSKLWKSTTAKASSFTDDGEEAQRKSSGHSPSRVSLREPISAEASGEAAGSPAGEELGTWSNWELEAEGQGQRGFVPFRGWSFGSDGGCERRGRQSGSRDRHRLGLELRSRRSQSRRVFPWIRMRSPSVRACVIWGVFFFFWVDDSWVLVRCGVR